MQGRMSAALFLSVVDGDDTGRMLHYIAVALLIAAAVINGGMDFDDIAGWKQLPKGWIVGLQARLIGDGSFQRDGILLFQLSHHLGKEQICAVCHAAEEVSVAVVDGGFHLLAQAFLYGFDFRRGQVSMACKTAGARSIHIATFNSMELLWS